MKRKKMEELTRDVRTVFVGQLQVRATEKDIKRFFKKAAKVKVNDVQVRSWFSLSISLSLFFFDNEDKKV